MSLIFVFVSCSNIFEQPNTSDPADTGLESGIGLVTISLGYARNILPVTVFDSYEFTFTRTGYTTVTETELTGISLAVGTWTLDVKAYKGTGEDKVLAATANQSITIQEGTQTVTITLTPAKTEGNGTFTYYIQIPTGTTVDELSLDDVALGGAVTSGGITTYSGAKTLSAGSYFLIINLTNAAGNEAGDFEAVWIYPDNETQYGTQANPKVFASTDFKTPHNNAAPINNVGTTITEYEGFAFNVTGTPASGNNRYATATQYATYTDSTGTYSNVIKIVPPAAGYTGWGGYAMSRPNINNSTVTISMDVFVQKSASYPNETVYLFWQSRTNWNADQAAMNTPLASDQFGKWITISQTFTTTANETIALMGSNSDTASESKGLLHSTIYIKNFIYYLNGNLIVGTPVPATGISLNKTTASIVVGNPETLIATFTPADATNKAVTWSSSNTAVATVSNTGVVTGLTAGKTTITATAADGGFKATCEVTVTVVPVTGLTLPPTLAVDLGSTGTLTAVVAPENASDKSYTWTSSDTDVASISGTGATVTITPVRGGTATITVKLGTFTRTCTVTVAAPPLTDFSLGTISTLTVGANARIALTTVPATAALPSDFSWSSSNDNIARVSQKGNVIATGYSSEETGLGTATITASGTINGEKVTKTVAVNTTIYSTVNLANLDPFYVTMQNTLGADVEIGQVFSGYASNIGSVITRNFNAFTPENDMKPPQYSWNGTAATGSASVSSTASNAASTTRKVHGHTLLWHNKTQIAQWMRQQVVLDSAEQLANRSDNTRRMEKYITDVITAFKGKVVGWDVINEAISGGGTPYTSHLRGNIVFTGTEEERQEKITDYYGTTTAFNTDDNSPWYTAVGPDYIYIAFKAARKAAIAMGEPALKLYANDYNLDTGADRCNTYVDMITSINNRWLNDPDYVTGTKLIDGIGMQAHFNTSDFNNGTFASNLKKFADNGIEIVITELDATTTSYYEWTGLRLTNHDGMVHWGDDVGRELTGEEYETRANKAKSPAMYLKQAQIYANAFNSFKTYKSAVKRITFWGLQDSASWRKEAYPLPFDGDAQTPKAKPAYYGIIDPNRILNPAQWLIDHP
jgi:GH35 family endo-1,4-beta-xylanase